MTVHLRDVDGVVLSIIDATRWGVCCDIGHLALFSGITRRRVGASVNRLWDAGTIRLTRRDGWRRK